MPTPRTAHADPIVLVHGGVGASPDLAGECERAAEIAAAGLAAGESALSAVVAAVAALEDDPRFNAGHGSQLGLDGVTLELDAAVMDSGGRYGAVAVVQGVPNPVRVAEKLAEGPARFLAGEGARRFAERHGLAGPVTTSDASRAKLRRMAALAAAGRLHTEYAAWRGVDLRAIWNYPTPMPDFDALARGGGEFRDRGATGGTGDHRASGGAGDGPCDTVGAVARDRHGRFATATSTGGTALMLYGRVGDSPLVGCGLYAGPAGAVTVTGEGEEIMVRLSAVRIYDDVARGVPPGEACRRAADAFPAGVEFGAIAVSAGAIGSASTHTMPEASRRPA